MKWKTARIGDVCQIISGTTPSTKIQTYWDGDLNWVTPGEIEENSKYIFSTQKKITEQAVKETNLRLLPIGTVLLSSRAPIGKVAIAATEMYCNQGFKNLICSKEVHNEFLFWFLRGKKDFLNFLGRGATFKEISKDIVAAIELPLPPLAEQRRIADILDKADAIRRKRQQSLKLTDDLVKSQFVEMFGDPVTNPKGWPIAKVGDLADVFTGGTPSRNKLDYYIGNIPWVKTGEIEQGLIFNAEERISEKALKETNCKLLPVNTILVAMYGQGKTRGQAGILKIKAATNQACAAILPNDSYNTDYLHQYLRIQYEALRGLGRGAQQANLNLSMVRDFPVLNTPLTLQTQFAAFVGQADKSKFTMQRQLSEIEILSSALKQKFFA